MPYGSIPHADCSIPIVTRGAVLSAGSDAARRDLEGVANVTANYLCAFKNNFVKAILIWLAFRNNPGCVGLCLGDLADFPVVDYQVRLVHHLGHRL